MKEVARTVVRVGAAVGRAVIGKLSARVRGKSPPAASCQIPEIRAKYEELGFAARSGTFIEIGGFDGESWSNTSFLADQGWRGLYVEPIPRFARLIRLRHALNDVTVEVAGIAKEAGSARINVMGSLTTLDDDMAEQYSNLDWARAAAARRQVQTITLRTIEQVASQHGFDLSPDLCVIDVEGLEEPILKSLFAAKGRPRVLIVELMDRHPDFDAASDQSRSHARTRSLILSNGYREFYADHINTIFARMAA